MSVRDLSSLSINELQELITSCQEELENRTFARPIISIITPEYPDTPYNEPYKKSPCSTEQVGCLYDTKPPDYWSSLSSFSFLPSTKQIIMALDRYEPTKYCSRDMHLQINLFLRALNKVTISAKPIVLRHFFRLMSLNIEFVKNNLKFHMLLCEYLEKFKTNYSIDIRNIANEFEWMKNIHSPKKIVDSEPVNNNQYPQQCWYCGGECPVRDKEKFCSLEHRELFSLNGDCKHDPNIVVEQLDKELDDYMICVHRDRNKDSSSVKVADFGNALFEWKSTDHCSK